MVLDIVFLLVIVAAFYSGFKQGIIYAVMSFIGIFLGVVVALNFSTFAGVWLVKNFNIPEIIIPVISFVVVLVVVVASIKMVAFLVQRILQTINLNFVNKLAGGALFGVLAAFIFSVLFSFIDNYGIFTDSLKLESQVYPIISTFGPQIFETASELIPLFKDIYQETNDIFKNAAENM